ncbi:MAG: substrate-binding domain-containing protein [Phycisphaerae bacterium]|nr:substrate-binding domain-containing protein [Phycisphaerae bacterium]
MTKPTATEQLLYALAQGIVEGRWLPDRRLPTSRDLAREFGVSAQAAAGAVRLAADRGLVSLRRKQPAIVLPQAAQISRELLASRPAPRLGDSRMPSGPTRIALLHPEEPWPSTEPFRVSLSQHIDVWAEKMGLVFDLVRWPLKNQVPFALSLPAQGYAGAACVYMHNHYLTGLTALRSREFPTIVINRRFPYLGLTVVTSDDYKPVRDLALRLIGMGHRNLSLVSHVLVPVTMETHPAIRGWVDGLAEGGVIEECCMPTYIIPDLPPLKQSRRIFSELLLRPDRPTALFFYWPTWLDILLTDPRFSQFRVPNDLSIVVAIAGERPLMLSNMARLTTLDLDYDRMGECIVRTMAGLIAGESCPERLLLPLKLHQTDSIGPPPAK